MKYAPVKFRVYLLGSNPFVVCTDHASLRPATQSPHFFQRMARWRSFFAEYNFEVKYKPGKQNGSADAPLADLIMSFLMSRLCRLLLRSEFVWHIDGILSVWHF